MLRPLCRKSRPLAGRVKSSRYLPNAGLSSTLAIRTVSTNPGEANTESSDTRNAGFLKGIAVGTAGFAALLGLYTYIGAKREAKSLSSSGILASTAFSTDYASPEELQLAIKELRNTFPEKHVVATDPDTLQHYGSSENSYHPSSPHSVVVRVFGTEDVVKVVNISRKYRVPVTAYSGATSLEGHFAGVRHSWLLFGHSKTSVLGSIRLEAYA